MKQLSKNTHLCKADIIKNGSIFTPNYIVDLIYSMVNKYIDNKTTIIDFGSGYGSFIDKFNNSGKRCIGTEIDEKSYEFLKENFKETKFYLENSLLNVNRKKYQIKNNEKLLIIGNPPYNDITSQYRKGQKGQLECDYDLLSRDKGISFIKAYNKLNADIICILHPLSYLIKKQNFKTLGEFTKNYKLEDAIIFSSKEFESIRKTNSDFPVIAALYTKNNNGMDFNYIYNFNFNVYNSDKFFCLKNFKTIDGIVSKYPSKITKTNLQFYTLRDMNSLIRNAGFIEGPKNNGINVTVDNLYQYAWLLFLKENFKPQKNNFLYGNLSPLYLRNIDDIKIKNYVVSYAWNNCNIIKKYLKKEDIETKYGKITNNYNELYDELKKLYVFE